MRLLIRRSIGATVIGFAFLLAACGTSGGTVRLDSVMQTGSLKADLPVRVYRYADNNTADFYLTDLPADCWSPEADLTGVSGSLIHIHLFIAPKAGSTPIADTASNVNIRYVVIAAGRAGVYAGGGFLHTSGDAGDTELGGTIRDASVKLLKATPGFEDRLGAAEFSAKFGAMKDERRARALEMRLKMLMPN